jgi:hypothetical protein
MAITRTIYTQGAVTITKQNGGSFDAFAVLSGVQNASFSLNTPRENVSQFGAKGLIDKVQVAPTEASITCSFIIPDKAQTAGSHITAAELNTLITDAQATSSLPNYKVSVGGIGEISGAILSSINVNAAVGDLPTIELTFDGVPTNNSSDAENTFPATVATPPVATAYSVTTPAIVSGFGTVGGVAHQNRSLIASDDSVQTFTFSWEMPVERIQRLGEGVNLSQPFGNPPGTATITLEGTNVVDNINNLSGLVVGPYNFAIGGVLGVTSREHSMAVGDVAATFNVTLEGTADAVVIKIPTDNA